MDEKNMNIQNLSGLHELINFAEHLPIDEISTVNTDPIYPVTLGEKLVNYMLAIILVTEWSDAEDEAAIGEITDILNQLDTGVDAEKLWAQLFIANKSLGYFLKKGLSDPT